MGPGVDVLRIALERRSIANLRLVEFALLKIDVSQLEMMMGFIEVMNLGLELFDAMAMMSAGQFKAARGRGRGAIDREIIKERRDSEPNKDEHSPKPFAPPNRVDEHPKLEEIHE